MGRCALAVVVAASIVACGVPVDTGSDLISGTRARTSSDFGTASPDVLVPPPIIDAADLSACRTPTSLIAPVIYLHTSAPRSAGEPASPDLLDTQTLYIAGGPAGVGLLCHGSTASGPPALSATAPLPGAIAYLVEDNSGIWGAVGPRVARVDLTLTGYTRSYSFTLDNPVATLDLRSLGNGWHAFNTDVGFSPSTPTGTATAYNLAGQSLGTRVVTSHR